MICKAIEMTDEELLKATFETYKVVKKHDFIPESLFFYLENTGKLVLTPQQKGAIITRVMPTYWHHPSTDTKARARAEARKIAVADYFNEMIKTGK